MAGGELWSVRARETAFTHANAWSVVETQHNQVGRDVHLHTEIKVIFSIKETEVSLWKSSVRMGGHGAHYWQLLYRLSLLLSYTAANSQHRIQKLNWTTFFPFVATSATSLLAKSDFIYNSISLNFACYICKWELSEHSWNLEERGGERRRTHLCWFYGAITTVTSFSTKRDLLSKKVSLSTNCFSRCTYI